MRSTDAHNSHFPLNTLKSLLTKVRYGFTANPMTARISLARRLGVIRKLDQANSRAEAISHQYHS